MRRILILGLVLLTLLAPSLAEACVGARPLGMGGAFVAMSDSDSVYWNPAGLAFVDERSAQATYTLNNRDYFNYDFFASYVEPDGKYGVGGLSIITIKDLAMVDGTTGDKLYDQQQWYVYSMGKKISDKLAVGCNVRYERYGSDLDPSTTVWGYRLAADAGLLATVADWLSLGVLLQDLTGTDIRFEGVSEEGPGLNVRPGMAVFPDGATAITFDIYDALDSFGVRGYRLGGERRLTENLAVRVGLDRGLSVQREAWTLGIGWKQQNWSIDYVFLGGDLGDTHQVGVKVTF